MKNLSLERGNSSQTKPSLRLQDLGNMYQNGVEIFRAQKGLLTPSREKRKVAEQGQIKGLGNRMAESGDGRVLLVTGIGLTGITGRIRVG